MNYMRHTALLCLPGLILVGVAGCADYDQSGGEAIENQSLNALVEYHDNRPFIRVQGELLGVLILDPFLEFGVTVGAGILNGTWDFDATYGDLITVPTGHTFNNHIDTFTTDYGSFRVDATAILNADFSEFDWMGTLVAEEGTDLFAGAAGYAFGRGTAFPPEPDDNCGIGDRVDEIPMDAEIICIRVEFVDGRIFLRDLPSK